ncbi:MAG TPA: NAD-binding protein [Gemmataceae bacterium]|nr:NAD-binding protein [Gemmataceae bacterium]
MGFRTHLLIRLRFGGYLLWEFRWPLAVFWGMVLLGGLGLWKFYHPKDGAALGYAEACFAVFGLAFLQPPLPFPQEWYLQPFFFLVPMIGLGAVADSLIRLGYLVFARKTNLPEWQRMIASLYREHLVVVGVGKIGYRVIKELLALREPVVAVELKADSEFVDEIRTLGVPVIAGNGRHRKTLEQAGAANARAIIVVTDDDLANLDCCLTAREINPKIQVAVRLFDDTLATKFASRFDMPAISTSEVSAQAFIAAATGRKVYHSFRLDDARLHLTDLTIAPNSALAGRAVGDVQANYAVNLVMHRAARGVDVNPAHENLLAPGDTVLVIAPMERLVELEAANHANGANAASRIPAEASSPGPATADPGR